jgi:KduI/IolB family
VTDQFTAVPLQTHAQGRSARLPECRHFTAFTLLDSHDTVAVTTNAEESGVVVLAGTFDLQGGPTHWGNRGARAAPAAGRPVAIFLPPHTPFEARGRGELLLVSARQPEQAPVTGRQALSQKPLLPLAGSGKAFDPRSGEWLPAETFPTAAELLAPRRMQHLELGTANIERVFGPAYKATTLCLDEAVINPGGILTVRELPDLPASDELLVYVRTPGTALLHWGSTALPTSGEGLFLGQHAPGEPRLVATAGDAPCYVLLAYAGK